MSIGQFILLLITGVGAGFTGGLFGIGGGVIIVPALYIVFQANGVPDAACIKLAVGTSLATIIITSIRSLQGHHANHNVEWSLLRAWAPWIVGGSIAGAAIARFVDPKALTLFFAISLFVLAIQRIQKRNAEAHANATMPSATIQHGLASTVGVISSLLGIGGGVMGVLLLTRTGRSVHRAVGTAAGFGLAISIPGALGYMLAGSGIETNTSMTIGYVSLPSFAAIALGTAVMAPIGAHTAARLNADLLNRIFAIYMAIVSVLMFREALFV